jgi:hypothetical protein
MAWRGHLPGALARLVVHASHAPYAPYAALAALAALAVVPIGACKGDPEEFDDPDVPGRSTNPDGVPYPTDSLGSAKRVGKIPGDRIPNLTFQAYVDGDVSKGLAVVSLADFYDPNQTRNKVLHIEGAATWCEICASEADATTTAKAFMNGKGVVYLEVIVSGPTQQRGPSLGDVTGWMSAHKSNFSTAIDVRARRMSGIGVDGTVMPWDILIDTRTMEILDSSGGAPADIVDYDSQFVDFVNTHPPSY